MAALVAANAVPLAGVLFLGWDLVTLVAIYWAENGVVGLYAVLRILTAGAGPGSPARSPLPPGAPPALARLAGNARWLVAPLFAVHYGLFWLGHGVFVWLVLPWLFASAAGRAGPGAPLGSVAGPDAGAVVSAAAFLAVSHGVSFLANWLLGGERWASGPGTEAVAPYQRVVILHLTILLGAVAVAIMGAPVWAMAVMVALKTWADLAAHLAERHRAALRMGTTRATA